MIFAFLTKIPLTSIIVVSASVISLILSSVSHDVISIKKVRIKLCILILFLFILLIRILANLALFDNLSQSDLDYIITISLAMVIYITFLVRPNPVALKYGILSAVIFTIVLALIEYILHVNTGSSRFEDPTNMFYLSDNRVPTAFYYNENDMLYFIILFIPFVCQTIKNNILSKAIFISAFLLALIITSKAAIITMCIYFLWNIYNEPKGKSIFIAYISLAFLFLIILLLSWNYLSSTGLAEKVLYRFSGLIDFLSGTGGDNSSNERFEIYTSVFSFLANNIDMIFFGFGSFSYYESVFLREYSLRIADFHNMYLELLTLFGSFVYVFILIFILRRYIELKSIYINGRRVFNFMIVSFCSIMSIISSSIVKYPSFYVFLLLLVFARKYMDKKNEF